MSFPPGRIKRWFSFPKRSDLLCRPFSASFGLLSSGHEVGHSPSSSAVVKNEWSLTSAALIYLYGVHRHDFAFACTCFFARGPYAASTRPSVPVTNCDCPSTLIMSWRQEEARAFADLGEKKRKDGHSPLVSAICH